MSSPAPGCRFCLVNGLINDQPLFQNTTSYFLASADPILPHGGMIIPFRHLTTPFELDTEEWLGTQEMLAKAKAYLMPIAPDGFTIGWNVGAVGGQTVGHVHLHVIARFSDEPLAGQGLRHHIKQLCQSAPATPSLTWEPRMARAVIFDVDGVVIHGYHANPAYVRAWDVNLLADTGVDPDRFRQEFIFDIFMKKVIIGQMSLVEALERRLRALGYRGSPMTFLRYWLEHDSVLNKDLLAAIRQLKSKADIRLYLATNQEHLRANWLFSHLRLCDVFEDIFYAARIGVQKPHDAFFRFVDDRIGHQAELPLFFDDSPKVIAGARAAGWDAVLFNTVDGFITHPWVAERLAP